MIKRIIRLLMVTALLVLALAVPAFAQAVDVSLPEKYSTYGDCVSDRAQAWDGPASIYTQTTDPYDPLLSKGAPHPGRNVACYDPPGGEDEDHPIS